jgi:hypothetical protein
MARASIRPSARNTDWSTTTQSDSRWGAPKSSSIDSPLSAVRPTLPPMSWGDFIKDHGEAAITTAVGALLGYLVSWFFARGARHRKYISWNVEVDEWLIGKNAPPGLTVSYDEVELKAPRLVSVRVINAGNRGIQSNDLTRPLSIHIEGASIQSCEFTAVKMVTPVEPAMTLPEITTLEIAHLQMNPGDSFRLRLVVDGGTRGHVSVAATLFEESSQPRRDDELSRPSLAALIALQIVLVPLGVYSLAILSDVLPLFPNVPEALVSFTIVLTTVVSVLLAWRTYRQEFKPRRRLARQTAVASVQPELPTNANGRTIDTERRPGA